MRKLKSHEGRSSIKVAEQSPRLYKFSLTPHWNGILALECRIGCDRHLRAKGTHLWVSSRGSCSEARVFHHTLV